MESGSMVCMANDLLPVDEKNPSGSLNTKGYSTPLRHKKRVHRLLIEEAMNAFFSFLQILSTRRPLSG